MLTGVLFDLDGTLLDIDIDAFLRAYFGALGPVVASVVGPGTSPKDALAAVMAATEAMCAVHDGQTNREVFEDEFLRLTGADLSSDSARQAVDAFYAEVFPELGRAHGPREGARAAVDAAKANGMTVVVATNPIFPRVAIVERLRWAGFSADEFALVTSYETMRACKPHPAYFAQTAQGAGLDPRECLMVGDDRTLDLPAADTGMRTFFVGRGEAPTASYRGDLKDLAGLIERIAEAG